MRVGTIIRKWRAASTEMSVRELADQIGVGVGTLIRVESGKKTDGETMLKLQQWLFSEESNGTGKGKEGAGQAERAAVGHESSNENSDRRGN